MNSQQIYDRSKKIAILFLMLEVFKTNRYLDTNVVNTIHLLKFNQTIMNTIIPFFSYLNLKAPQQGRPKPDGFWVDVFPYLTDNEGYNSFRKHFCIIRYFRCKVHRNFFIGFFRRFRWHYEDHGK